MRFVRVLANTAGAVAIGMLLSSRAYAGYNWSAPVMVDGIITNPNGVMLSLNLSVAS